VWWELNRWNYFPTRGTSPAKPAAVVTPSSPTGPKVDAQALARQRRALVARQQIVPFLLRLLDTKRRTRDEVVAAALLALAKLTHEDNAIEVLFRRAEDRQASHLVRESAALAVGLIRRSDAAQQKDGVALDAVRGRLLRLLDDKDAPDRTRAFAALAVGLLGDQPFGDAFTREGRVITRALWERALRKRSNGEIPVALLTALGMQPPGGVAAEVKEGLRRIVTGRRIGGHGWDANERSHALTALARGRGDDWTAPVYRALTTKRLPTDVRRAAFIALGARCSSLSRRDRLDAAEAAGRGLDLARDNLTRGLGLLALGRLLGADLREDRSWLVERSRAASTLLAAARHGPHGLRGFASLGVALALRGATCADKAALTMRADGLEALTKGFEKSREPSVRSAYAVALGLLGPAAQTSAPAMATLLGDRRADAGMRGHIALALAWVGDGSAAARKAMRTALWDRRSVALRSQAALALSFLGGRTETSLLVQELHKARSQWVLAQVAAALGQLDDIRAVPAIIKVAADEKRAEEARALAIASLGLLGDPEPRPSMMRLTRDANYPAKTDALHEAFSIL